MKVKEFFKNLFGSLVMLNCLGMIIVSLILCMGVFYGLDIYTNHRVGEGMIEKIKEELMEIIRAGEGVSTEFKKHIK